VVGWKGSCGPVDASAWAGGLRRMQDEKIRWGSSLGHGTFIGVASCKSLTLTSLQHLCIADLPSRIELRVVD
jgi:hypothetical protein